MPEMKNIVVPTDFSDNAYNAFDYAVQLYGINDVNYILLNSYHSPSSGTNGMFVSIDEMLAKDSKKELKRKHEKLIEKYPGIEINRISEYGTLDEVINHLDVQGNIHSVVMGTTGASGLKKALIGSNAQKVISEADFPVFTIPRGYKFTPIEKIVFAADLEDIPSKELFTHVKSIAGQFNSHISILHVDHSKDENKKVEKEKNRLSLESYLNDISHSFHTMKRYDVAEGIDSFVFDNKTDLLVLVPKKMTFLRSLFRRGITRQIVCHSRVPLLSLKLRFADKK